MSVTGAAERRFTVFEEWKCLEGGLVLFMGAADVK